ncbi:glycoside hydrolase family 18 protein [Apiospora arundinis]
MAPSRRLFSLPLLGLVGLLAHGPHPATALRDLCPATCMQSGAEPANWTVVAEVGQLQTCARPLVVTFSERLPVTSKQHVRACNVWANDFDHVASNGPGFPPPLPTDPGAEDVVPELAWTPAASENDIRGRLVSQSVEHLQSYLANGFQAVNRTILFATVSGTTAGVYVGANLLNPSVAEKLFGTFFDTLWSVGIADSKAGLVQVCDGRTGDSIFGLIAAASGDFSLVHDAASRWSNGSCVDTSSYGETRKLDSVSIATVKPTIAPMSIGGNSTSSNTTRTVRGLLHARADCRTETVEDGDSCGKLVSRCGNGLTAQDFYKYNPASDLCSGLMPGQRVCCTSGNLPDIRPKKNADGSCDAYQIQKGDSCAKIAVASGLTVKELESFNKDTWGWNGCDYGFWPDNWLCRSEGTPPFPFPIANAVCGPQKPGSKKPSGSSSKDWAKMNPCPLNTCCNIWGQCGTTVDFCIDTNTGPPGTAKKDTYGCISNCGMTIVQSSPPAQFIKLGYFEGFNLGRKCLHMDASQIDPSYTHVHFAFGMITDTFEIYQENKLAEFQFQQFKKLRGPKRIISFGGWVFSAEAPNYPIFRNGVKAENREKLATNLVKYVVDNGLDGLDLDWEYPSAPDLPDIPAGDLSEAIDYLRLLALLRRKLPKDKSLSIAAPASFWYLKQFPIKAIGEIVDYIVYMTYDLHGQWDAGNQWASSGCPTGNCLRSHINRTETMGALTMITKAGVPSNKVLVGVSSYGRSFQMVDPSCTGPNCLFTGNRETSHARKGRCTDTGGYLANAELSEINGRTWTDTESNSKIMVDGDLWVSYMDDSLKDSRTQLYKRYNLGGTIDWAVDLVKFRDPPNYGIPGGVHLELDWTQVKNNIQTGESAACSRGTRTGDWVNKQCTLRQVTIESSYTPAERWEALDCKSAWEDTTRVWFGCHAGKDDQYRFGRVVGEFLHAENGALIKNYGYSLQTAGNNLRSKSDSFISTFAPKPEGGEELFSLLLTLIQLPIGMAGSRFFGGSLMAKAFFSNDASGNKKEALEKATMGVVDIGFDVAREALTKAKDAREEIAFGDIFDKTIGAWKSQTDTLMAKIFDGEEKNVNRLTDLFSDGKMLTGKGKGGGFDNSRNHTTNWYREKAIERAFYAAAIPAAWGANRPAPVVVDFGPNCKIDARKYFNVKPDQYNMGYRCINGHSYILAGVRDGPPQSIEDIDNPLEKWGHITTEDLIVGTDIRVFPQSSQHIQEERREEYHGAKQRQYGGSQGGGLDNALSDGMIDIRKANFIRIPVCGPEEAEKNLEKGRESYGDSLNFPCDA